MRHMIESVCILLPEISSKLVSHLMLIIKFCFIINKTISFTIVLSISINLN